MIDLFFYICECSVGTMCGIKLAKMATYFLIFPSLFIEVEAIRKFECNMDKGFHGRIKQGWIVVCSLFLFYFNGIDGGNPINIIWCLKNVAHKQNLEVGAFVSKFIGEIVMNESLEGDWISVWVMKKM